MNWKTFFALAGSKDLLGAQSRLGLGESDVVGGGFSRQRGECVADVHEDPHIVVGLIRLDRLRGSWAAESMFASMLRIEGTAGLARMN